MATSPIVFHRVFFFQAEDGIRDLVRSRGLGDVYKRQVLNDSEAKRLQRTNVEAFGLLEVGYADADMIDGLSLIHI